MTHVQPAQDEVEFTLLGPGVGESAVVHVGNGDWLIADSCSSRVQAQRPAALVYLEQLGVDPSQVKAISISHWHRDHAYRVADLAAACPNATVAVTAAMTGVEFLQWTGLSVVGGAAGMTDLIAGHVGRVKPAIEDRTIYWANGPVVTSQVVALSPSDESVRRAAASIVNFIPDLRAGRLNEPPRTEIPPNRTSIVLWIRVGDVAIIVGGDLEVEADASVGWDAVFRAHGGRLKASIYKVAHHGSGNADDSRIWADLLQPEAQAVLTPYASGSVPLPRPNDVTRICRQTANAYTTAARTVPATRDPAVRRTLAEAGIHLESAQHDLGYVQIRVASDGQSAPAVVLGDAAAPLCP